MPADLGATVAVLLLAAPLVVAQHAAGVAPGLPLELVALLLLLAVAPSPVRRVARIAVPIALLAILLLALVDLATAAALNRRFNPALDLPLVADGWRLAQGALGRPMAVVAAAALAATLALAALALWWAAGRLAARPAPGTVAVGLPLAALAALGLATGAAPRGATAAGALVWEHADAAWRARGDLAQFRAEAASDRWASADPGRMLARLEGRDVFLVFVESYGRAALENSLYAPTIAGTLTEAEAGLAADGLAARSAWLASPVVGGQSWLPRATLVSGLRVDSEGRYRALLASPRRTLLHLAAAAGWETAAVVPAITLPWPEGDWFGYDRVLAARDLGYAGRPFNWVTMPDQFTLTAVERLLLDPKPRKPVFAEIALISSHAPWTPVPPLLDWDAIGDGRAFNAYADAGDPPEVVWRDPDRVRTQYRLALDYALRTVAGFAERHAKEGPLLVVVGDHQPAAFVSGDPAGRAVPVHLIGPPEIVYAFPDWTPGMVPAADAPVLPMQAFRDRLLDAFSAAPAMGAATLGGTLPENRGH